MKITKRTQFPRLFRAGAAVLALAALVATPALADEQRIELPARSGVTQPFLVLTPAGPPVATVVLFTGGNGIVGKTGQNFLLRSRKRFAAAGFLVASVDVPSDRGGGFNAMARASYDHAQDVAAVIAWLRKKAAVPVWLIGTSTGTISAANVAARLRTGGADGLVMTSTFVPPISPPPAIETIVDVGAVAIPTLFVHNREDACTTSPFARVAPLMARFTRAPRKELIAVSGGSPPQSDACDALSRHGYLGIEDEVVEDIARWIKGG